MAKAVEINADTFAKLKRAYIMLDNDKDGKIRYNLHSVSDLKHSCSLTNDSEAKMLFEALNPSLASFISLQDFCKGVIEYPYLLEQFTQNIELSEPERASHSTPEILYKIGHALLLDSPESQNTEELLETISAELTSDHKRSKRQLSEICQSLFQWGQQMKELSLSLQTELSNKDFEYNLHQDFMHNERERIENNYNTLLTEHQNLDLAYKELQQTHLQLNHQLRESNLKHTHSERKEKLLSQQIEDFKIIIKDKDKTISDLNKKLRVTNSLSNLKDIPRSNTIATPKANVTRTFAFENIVTTPKSSSKKLMFDFDNEGIKDQVIKNLKNQVSQANFKAKLLEKEISELEKKNKLLVDKIQELKYQNCNFIEEQDEEDEGSNKFETLESLRDEIVMTGEEFRFSNRQSIRAGKEEGRVSMKNSKVLKEIGTQSEVLKNRKKKRFSCFSLFD